MKKYPLIVYALFFVILFSDCSDRQKEQKNANVFEPENPTDSNYQKKNFDNLIVAIDKEIGTNLDRSEELLGNKKFVEIYDHSSVYLQDAIKFLLTDTLSGWRPFVCILAMQNLSVNDYTKFCNVLAELYEKDKIKEGMLQEAITPNFLEKRIIIKNYADPDVIKLLQRIQNNKKVSKEFNDRIEGILSGTYLRDIKN